MKSYIFVLLSFIVSLSLSAAQKPLINKVGRIVNASALHKEPKYQSDIVSQLVKDDAVNIILRNRAWYHISTFNELSGWIKMLDVRFEGALKREGELGVESVFSSVINRKSSPTASTGIRGFDEDDIKSAVANIAQVKLLSNYQASQGTAQKFANEGQLMTVISLDIKGDK